MTSSPIAGYRSKTAACVDLHFEKRMSYAQIAAKLDIPQCNVSALIASWNKNQATNRLSIIENQQDEIVMLKARIKELEAQL